MDFSSFTQPLGQGASGMNLFLVGLYCLLAGGIVATLVPEKWKSTCMIIGSGFSVPLISYPALSSLLSNQTYAGSMDLGSILGIVNLGIDPLSAFFILLVSVMSFIGIIYSAGYLQSYLGKKKSLGAHNFFLAIFIIFMLLVLVVSHGLAFLMVWEIMSLSSFFLILFDNEQEEVIKAGLNYLVAMHISVIFLIVGFLILSIHSGSYDFTTYSAVFQSDLRVARWLFILFFVGFGIKAGFVPFHSWLPKAHPAAPSHISGMMSGIMINIGIYGILRILLWMGIPTLGLSIFVLVISVITGLLGVVYALSQKDIKKLLAYSSVENIGIIGMGIGTGMLGLSIHNPIMTALGFFSAFLHILNHSVFKGLLFFSAGSVYLQTHTRDMEQLGGLAHKMKNTSVLFLIGSIAISGLPPLNGFVSEFLLYMGLLNGVHSKEISYMILCILAIFGLALIGGLAFICFTKAYSIIFLGNPRTKMEHAPKESGRLILFPMTIMAIFCGLLGLFPQYIVQLIQFPVSQITHITDGGSALDLGISLVRNISVVGGLFIVLFGMVYFLRERLVKAKGVESNKTWDCGYQAGNTRMQYTGSSYAKLAQRLSYPAVQTDTQIEKPVGLFPLKANFESKTRDLFEEYIIDPVCNRILRGMDLFSWIQTGNTQQYVLYGLIFLILILVWVMGIR